MNAIFNFDASILLFIQNVVRQPWLSPIVIFITHLGDKGIMWIALTLALIVLRRTRRTGVTSAVAMVIGLLAVNLVLKNWIARIRPYELVEGLQRIIEKQKDFSFPSGHACNSFAAGWAMFRGLKKRWGVPALILAILISLSRMYVGVHYPTDVLAGAAIGIAAAEAARAIVRALNRRFPAFREFTRPKKRSAQARKERQA